MSHQIERNRRRLLLATAAGAATSLIGCGGGIDDDVRLRAVNATDDVPAIDVDYNGWTFAFDVRQGGEASRYAERSVLVVGGVGEFTVYRSNDSRRLYSTGRSLPHADSASVVIMGSRSDSLKLRLIDEDADRPFGGSDVRWRVLHALPDQGALDVHLSPADAPLAGRAAEWSLDGYEDLSGFVERPASGRLRVTRRGNPQQVLFDSRATDLEAGSVGTLVLAPASSRGRLAVAVLPQGRQARVLTDG